MLNVLLFELRYAKFGGHCYKASRNIWGKTKLDIDSGSVFWELGSVVSLVCEQETPCVCFCVTVCLFLCHGL